MTTDSKRHSVHDQINEQNAANFQRLKDENARLEEQLEASRKALRNLIEWADDERGDDFGSREWEEARAVLNPASEPETAIEVAPGIWGTPPASYQESKSS